MPSEAQKKASKKYIQENLESLNIRVTKGTKAVFKAHAASTGESLAAFIVRAAKETMERDQQS